MPPRAEQFCNSVLPRVREHWEHRYRQNGIFWGCEGVAAGHILGEGRLLIAGEDRR